MLTFLILVSIADATQDSDAWVNKGNALFDLYKFDEAIKAYDKAIEINPQNINALQNRKEVLPLSQVG
jgi:tetratricopeptide (TPR) repeat protein